MKTVDVTIAYSYKEKNEIFNKSTTFTKIEAEYRIDAINKAWDLLNLIYKNDGIKFLVNLFKVTGDDNPNTFWAN